MHKNKHISFMKRKASGAREGVRDTQQGSWRGKCQAKPPESLPSTPWTEGRLTALKTLQTFHDSPFFLHTALGCACWDTSQRDKNTRADVMALKGGKHDNRGANSCQKKGENNESK